MSDPRGTSKDSITIAVEVTNHQPGNVVKPDEVKMDRPVKEWTAADLSKLCNKLQFLISESGSGAAARRTCKRAKSGNDYVVAVTAGGLTAQTQSLALSDTLAQDPMWETKA
jgi:hypothetical protein